MKKIILAISIISTINPLFAYTGQKFRVLDESTNSTPGFNFKVEEATQTSKNAEGNISASARADAPNRSGTVGGYSQIDGYHTINISNNTNKNQTYEYAYSLDCEESHGSYTRHIEVYPGGFFSTNDHSYGTVQKYSVGTYRITATTKVSGESSASDTSYGNLYISK
jgi:hypothetical protein